MRKLLSNVQKAKLLSKAKEPEITLSSIEKLGVISKAEELQVLILLERAASFSPAVLASLALPFSVGTDRHLLLQDPRKGWFPIERGYSTHCNSWRWKFDPNR